MQLSGCHRMRWPRRCRRQLAIRPCSSPALAGLAVTATVAKGARTPVVPISLAARVCGQELVVVAQAARNARIRSIHGTTAPTNDGTTNQPAESRALDVGTTKITTRSKIRIRSAATEHVAEAGGARLHLPHLEHMERRKEPVFARWRMRSS